MKRTLLTLMLAASTNPLMGMERQDSNNWDLFRITAFYCSVALCNKKDGSVSCISIKFPYESCGGCTTCGLSCHTKNCTDDSRSRTGIMQ